MTVLAFVPGFPMIPFFAWLGCSGSLVMASRRRRPEGGLHKVDDENKASSRRKDDAKKEAAAEARMRHSSLCFRLTHS